MSINSLFESLQENVRDNYEWVLAFRDEQTLESFDVPRVRLDSEFAVPGGATTNALLMTPDEAAIPVCDDARVLAAFADAGVAMPMLKLAGARTHHRWSPEQPLRVGVVTAGGNAPGLNMVIDSVVKRHHEFRRDLPGHLEVYGYLGGFPGMLNQDRAALVPSSRMVSATDAYGLRTRTTLVTDDFALEGCTRLGTQRGATDDGTVGELIKVLHSDGIDILHTIGGDGTIRASYRIASAYETAHPNRPLSVVSAVKTMDNDVVLTEPSFGFYSVVDEAIRVIRTLALEAETLNRVAIIQLFGAASGFVALYAAYCSGEVDWVALPETLPEFESQPESPTLNDLGVSRERIASIDAFATRVDAIRRSMVKHVARRLNRDDKRHAVVVLAEGAVPTLADPRTAADHQHSPQFKRLKESAFSQFVDWFGTELKRHGLSNGILHNMPQHLIRGGSPNAFDAALCKYTGKLLADTALAGSTDCAVTMWHGRPVLVPYQAMTEPQGRQRKKFVQASGYFAATMLAKMAPPAERPDDAPEATPQFREFRTAIDEKMPNAEWGRLDAALEIAATAHEGKSREGKDKGYIEHPLHVARTVADSGNATTDEIAAAILHDTLEDAPDKISPETIHARCGPEVLAIVEALTCPCGIDESKLACSRRKIEKVLACPAAWRIKIADRIDNLRDSTTRDMDFCLRYHDDTVRHYLPLAERLGQPDLLDQLVKAIHTVRERIRRERPGLTCARVANLCIDFTGWYLPVVVTEDESLIEVAQREMAQLESGARVNKSEDRMVGHYWLRDPSRAPTGADDIRDDIQQVKNFGDQFFAAGRPKFERVLWIGIGGSALGPQFLYETFRDPATSIPFHFFDNVDPSGIARTLREIGDCSALRKTLVVVVSKSGGTKETRIGLEIARQQFAKCDLDFPRSAVAITCPGSQLDQEAAADGWLARFALRDWVGGRTSLFSPVGLLTLAILGVDTDEFLRGARTMDEATRSAPPDNPALTLALAWHYASMDLGLTNMAVLPYADKLSLLTRYLQQLVMESLGKEGHGITVFGNKGSTDQHSFVQQLRAGRRDFFATFLGVADAERDWTFDGTKVVDAATPTGQVTVHHYLDAFREGTMRALDEAGRHTMCICLPRVDAFSVAALIALFERTVGFYGAMVGINPYDQPGVEAGKKSANKIIEARSDIFTAQLDRIPLDDLERLRRQVSTCCDDDTDGGDVDGGDVETGNGG